MANDVGIKLFADTGKAIADIKKFDKSLDKAGDTGVKTGKSISKGMKVAAVGIAAVGAALVAMTIASAKAEMENRILARQAGLTTERFKEMDFAARQFGITGEQLADQAKDILDKAGEFATAGTGAFQDFADVMGLTKIEARETAKELQKLAGPEAIQFMVTQMEEAGATTGQMTFALESMGNDLSRLLPLFAKNGEGLDNLTTKYRAANDALKLTAGQQDALTELSGSFDLLTLTAGNAFTKIASIFAPAITGFFNDILVIVPKAVDVITDFTDEINILLNNLDAVSTKNLEKEMEDSKVSLDAAEKSFKSLNAAYIGFIETNRGASDGKTKGFLQQLRFDVATAERKYMDLLAVSEEVIKRHKEAADITKEIGGSGTAGVDDAAAEEQQKLLEMQEAADAKRLEQDARFGQIMLDQKARQFEMQRDAQEANDNMALVARKQVDLTNVASVGDASNGILTILELSGKKQSKLYKTLFIANKLAALANITVNTAQGITEALKLPPPLSYALATTTGIAGAAQAAVVASTAFAGGRASGGQVAGGAQYRAGEIGPEIFEDRQGRTTLIPPPGGGTVTPVKVASDPGRGISVNIVNNASGVAEVAQVREISEGQMEIIIERTSAAFDGKFAESLNSGSGNAHDSIMGAFNVEQRFA